MTDKYLSPNLPYSLLSCNGCNVVKFLQGQTSTDVTKLSPNKITPFTLCQYQGKIYAYGYMFFAKEKNCIHILIPSSISEQVLEKLKPYAELSKVQMSLITNIQNFQANGIISAEAISNELSSTYTMAHDEKYNITTLCICEKPFIYILIGNANKLQLWLAHRQHFTNTTMQMWMCNLIKSKQIFFDQKCIELFTPNMLNLVPSCAVSLNKGCYTGQEVIARTYHLGKVKRKLTSIYTEQITTSILPGDKLQIANHTLNATVLNSAVYEDILWLQVVMPEVTELNFLLNTQNNTHPIAFTAKIY